MGKLLSIDDITLYGRTVAWELKKYNIIRSLLFTSTLRPSVSDRGTWWFCLDTTHSQLLYNMV
jgi:hypothetical protein